MIFLELGKKFTNNESGAVTVDWVALTAVLVVIGGATLVTINSHIEGLAQEIGTHVEDQALG